jgi:glucokinase
MESLTLDEFAIALDLGGTQLRAALVDRHGQVLNRVAVLTRATQGPDVVIQQLKDAAQAVMIGVDRDRVIGIGLSVPGPLDAAAGVSISIPTIAGFENVKLREPLQRFLDLSVWLENDGTAAALAEWRFGVGVGLQNFVYITVSTGIGGGVVADNRLLRGRLGLAGEVGHMTIIRNGDTCSCGNKGCWEAYASGTAFTRRARKRVEADGLGLLAGSVAPIDGQAVFEAAALGDPVAMELVSEEAEFLGIGIANLLHLYSPEAIVIGGGMSPNLEILRPGILSKISEAAMKGFENVPIVRSALGGNSGLIGAASLVFDAVSTKMS